MLRYSRLVSNCTSVTDDDQPKKLGQGLCCDIQREGQRHQDFQQITLP
jgi:hypothetical protein